MVERRPGVQALAPQRSSERHEAPTVADASDLDGKYGDPKITSDPKKWTEKGGAPMKGRRLSEVPYAAVKAGYLSLYAERMDYFARRDEESGATTNEGKPLAPYKRKDAARARGWEQRILAAGPKAEEISRPMWGMVRCKRRHGETCS